MSPRSPWSQLVADVTEQAVTVGHISVCLDPHRRRAVGYAHDPAAAITDGDQDVNRVGGGAEDGADLRYGLDRVQHVDREPFPEQDHERMPGADRAGVHARGW